MLTSSLILAALSLVALATAVYVLVRNRRLEREVVRDALTAVGNRRGFDRHIEDLEQGAKVALIMIDFDYFKEINDRHGHAAGDKLLARVAGALRSALDRTYGARAQVYRLGGDEFAIIISGADSLHAAAVIERAREQVSDALEQHERALTISCGIACSPEHADEVNELSSYADRALYQAKRAGRDRTVVYELKMFDDDADRDSRNVLRTLADALAAAVDAKDAYTHAHSRNVSDLSLYLAQAMGLSQQEVSDIALGGLLHDIGKIGVSDHVLKKPGKLSQEEWEEIKTHCDIGYTILNGIDGAEHIREMVLYHHERPDGKGYPRGLERDAIPLPARIIGVADAFDSMTAERVYSTPRSPEDAIAEIVRLKGQQFDPDVVDALCQLMVYDVDGAAIEPEPTPLPAPPDDDAGDALDHVRAA